MNPKKLDFQKMDKYSLPTKNGYILNLKTGEFRLAEEKDNVVKTADAVYNPDVSSSSVLEQLSTFCDKDSVNTLIEILCAIVSGTNNFNQVYFLHGVHGKSTFIREFILNPMYSFSSVAPKYMLTKSKKGKDEDMISYIRDTDRVGCICEVCESDTLLLHDLDMFSYTIRRFHSRPRDVPGQTSFVINSSSFPKFESDDGNLLKKIVYVYFPHEFSPGSSFKLHDPDYSGWLNLIAERCKEVYARGRVENTEANQELLEKLLASNHSI